MYKVYIKIFTTTRKIWCWGGTWVNTQIISVFVEWNSYIIQKITHSKSPPSVNILWQTTEISLWIVGRKRLNLRSVPIYYNLPKVVRVLNWRYWFTPITFTGVLVLGNGVVKWPIFCTVWQGSDFCGGDA